MYSQSLDMTNLSQCSGHYFSIQVSQLCMEVYCQHRPTARVSREVVRDRRHGKSVADPELLIVIVVIIINLYRESLHHYFNISNFP